MVQKEAHQKIEFIKWFSELSNKDVPIAGGKGASLAEMYNSGIPVPPGFIITAQTYKYFIEKTGINETISGILQNLNVNNTAELNKASEHIRKTIEKTSFPKELEEEILEAYEILSAEKTEASEVLKRNKPQFVAVRSSATAEDLADASFAGQQESFLNVRGEKDFLEKVKECMSSLFTPRATFYRAKKGFKHMETYIAVVVQKMVNSVKSGVMFSQNPTSDDKSILIEAVWGLGEGIVSGKIRPDQYRVHPDLENFKVLKIEVANKKIAVLKNDEGQNEIFKLSEERSNTRVLDNYEIKTLAQLARRLEEHYEKPQDIEFAIDKTGIYIVQSRPITTKFKKSESEIKGDAILSGLAASPGIASGTVKIIHDISELEKVKEGDVMVTEMTNPDMVVAMQKSAAIITDEGGVTSHAAIVSREMGIPAVVGTDEATKKLKDGDIVTVDGSAGKVYPGKGETKLIEIKPIIKGTRTKIKVIADLPEGAERASLSEVDSIGLTRLEGIIAIGGKHPYYFVKNKKMNEYINLLSSNLKKIIKHYNEIWVRSSDIRSDEFSHLEGAPKESEANPMMGDHGIRFSLKHKDILKAEFTAIKEVADDFPDKKIGLMVPLLISVDELKKTKSIAEEVGMQDNIKIGVMVETPAAVQIIEELCKEGIDFISFGTNDLTQFTLALDRNNDEVANLFDETHPAVVREIQHVIQVCRKYGVETSICGQAGSKPEMARILVKEGINSISVNADAARKISEIIHEIESGEPAQISEEYSLPKEQPEEETGEMESEQEIPMEAAALSALFNPELLKEKPLENIDMEEIILKELESDEYNPGLGGEEAKEDIPPLNDSIPVTSDSFEENKE